MTDFARIVGDWMQPMFSPREPRLAEWLPIAVATAYCLAIAFLVHRTLDGSLARSEARWRHRSPAIRARLGHARSWLVIVRRTPGWWATRIEFAAAIAAFAALAVVLGAATEPSVGETGALSPLPGLLLPAISVAGMLVGLASMVRIYRAPLRLDSRAYWRYRDGA
ncbi:MAG TPA: hypothetical protein VGK16_15150 [Candidatus Limnocylindrales bacterium]|jgi:hypothetical protein